MKMWIARDQNYCLFLHEEKPHLETYDTINEWVSDSNSYVLDGNLFPEVTFENSPQEVELVIKK